MSRKTPARSYRSRISVVPSLERVVDREDEVDAGMEMECDLRVDDVRLVPREERHHEPHPTGSPTISSAASTTRSAARPSTVPTTCSTARRRASASSVRLLERALDPGDDLLEALGAIERAGRRELLVVLADDVLRRPRLPRRCALVVEHADGRPVARRERRAGSCPRCRRRHPHVGAASRAPRCPSSSPPAPRCPQTQLRPRSAPASGCRAGGAGREAAGASREV